MNFFQFMMLMVGTSPQTVEARNKNHRRSSIDVPLKNICSKCAMIQAYNVGDASIKTACNQVSKSKRCIRKSFSLIWINYYELLFILTHHLMPGHAIWSQVEEVSGFVNYPCKNNRKVYLFHRDVWTIDIFSAEIDWWTRNVMFERFFGCSSILLSFRRNNCLENQMNPMNPFRSALWNGHTFINKFLHDNRFPTQFYSNLTRMKFLHLFYGKFLFLKKKGVRDWNF